MSQIPRVSMAPMPRRSSSAESSANQYSSQVSQSARISNVGRQSSIGTGRSSSIGRVSMAPKAGESAKQPIDYAAFISQVLDDMNYSPPMTTKALMQPSATTFYALFEAFLKYIGIEDVWSVATTSKDSKQALNSVQAQQSNQVAQNKAKIDTIINHLQYLQYNFIPKPNVLQTMTTPRNWSCVLQILDFLANLCRFLMVYDAKKVLRYMGKDEDREIIHDYFRTAFALSLKNAEFIGTPEHKKLKKEAVDRYATCIRKDIHLEDLKAERDKIKKEYDALYSNRNELEELLEIEKNLLKEFEATEKEIAQRRAKHQETLKALEQAKKEKKILKEKTENLSKELAIKSEIYDRQIASGKKMENLQARHNQKLQELENLQNEYLEKDKKIDEMHSKLLAKSQELKDVITELNETISKIKLTSGFPIDDLPQIDILDIHKKNTNIIKEFKEKFTKVRNTYNQRLCELPNKIATAKNLKKDLEEKVDNQKKEVQSLEKEVKSLEDFYSEIQKRHQDKLKKYNKQYETACSALKDMEMINKALNDRISHLKIEFQEICARQAQIELDMKKQMEQKNNEINEIVAKRTEEVKKEEEKVMGKIKKQQDEISKVYEMFNDLNMQIENNKKMRKKLPSNLYY